MKNKKPLKSLTRQEMADELSLGLRTFERRLEEIKFVNGGKLITPVEQIWIKKKLGYLEDK